MNKFQKHNFHYIINELVCLCIDEKNEKYSFKPEMEIFSRRQLDALASFLRLAGVTPVKKSHKQVRVDIETFLLSKYEKNSNVQVVSHKTPNVIPYEITNPDTGEESTYNQLTVSGVHAYPGIKNLKWSKRMTLPILNELWDTQKLSMKNRCFLKNGKCQTLASKLLVEAKNAWNDKQE